MESAGFIKISRGILDSGIWEDGYDAALYFFFLLRASHNVYGRLKPGQFYSNVVKIARDLGWSRNGTAKHIDSLISKGLVGVSRDPDGTLYTVIGWAEICQEKSKAESISSDVHDMGTGANEMNKDAHDVNIDAHEMNEDAHDMNKGAHEMSTNTKNITKNITKKNQEHLLYTASRPSRFSGKHIPAMKRNPRQSKPGWKWTRQRKP